MLNTSATNNDTLSSTRTQSLECAGLFSVLKLPALRTAVRAIGLAEQSTQCVVPRLFVHDEVMLEFRPPRPGLLIVACAKRE
jgi:hypothetical protein